MESIETRILLQPESSVVGVKQIGKTFEKFKYISLDDFAQCLNGALVYPFLESGLLPRGCLALSVPRDDTRIVTLLFDRGKADISYNKIKYADFPLPQMVFQIKVVEGLPVSWCRIGVVEKGRPRRESKMYFYPFSNLYEDGRVCLGYNQMPCYEMDKLDRLESLPGHILSIPHNTDLYSPRNNRAGLSMGELLRRCKDKSQEYYYSEVLMENGQTLADFISAPAQEKM